MIYCFSARSHSLSPLQIITFDEASSGEEALHGPIFRAHMVSSGKTPKIQIPNPTYKTGCDCMLVHRVHQRLCLSRLLQDAPLTSSSAHLPVHGHARTCTHACARQQVHLFSLLHSLALDKMRQCDSLEQLQLLQPRDNAQRNCQVANNDLRMHFMSNPLTVLGDMDARERESLSASTEHVHLVMTWIHRALVRR